MRGMLFGSMVSMRSLRPWMANSLAVGIALAKSRKLLVGMLHQLPDSHVECEVTRMLIDTPRLAVRLFRCRASFFLMGGTDSPGNKLRYNFLVEMLLNTDVAIFASREWFHRRLEQEKV